MIGNYAMVDLFAGAGGLSEGFLTEGFNPIALVEKEKHNCSTLKSRIGYWWSKANSNLTTYREYLTGHIQQDDFYSSIDYPLDDAVIEVELNDKTIHSVIKKIQRNMNEQGADQLHVLLGGPPCQPFSPVGKARISLERANNDSRAFLYIYYLQILGAFKPHFFVFENVPAMKGAVGGAVFSDMKKRVGNLGYEMGWRVLDARDCLVPQRRKRLFIVGWQKELQASFPDMQKTRNTTTLNDILGDLPAIKQGEGKNVMDYAKKPHSFLQFSGIRDGWDILTHHEARPHIHRDIQIYKIAIRMWNEEQRRLRYNELPKQLQTHKNTKSFLDRFKVVAGNEPYSHTIVAHIAKDGHYYIHPDIKQARSLTVREAARLQSFPDDYYFEGPRTSRYAQIGNAVPPLLSKCIARAIKEMLR